MVWYRLLWRVSRLPLQLCTLHPDRVGGLAFVRDGVHAFTPLLLAHTVPLAGLVATRISHTGANLPAFRVEIVVMVVVLLAVVLVPLVFFRGPLAAAKRAAALANGRVARHWEAEFRRRTNEDPQDGARELARGADLARICDAGERTRTWLFTRMDLVWLACVIAMPVAPLALTMFPIEEIVARAVEVLF